MRLNKLRLMILFDACAVLDLLAFCVLAGLGYDKLAALVGTSAIVALAGFLLLRSRLAVLWE